MTRSIILIGVGGGVGSILRHLTTLFINKYVSTAFPFGTLIVNFFGCMLMGIIVGLFINEGKYSQEMKYLFATGFCGGYTTFSAFASENIQLFQNGNSFTAFVYIATSVIFSLFAVWLGLSIIKMI